MKPALTINKEQRVKLIKLIYLLDDWDFIKWYRSDLEIVNKKTKEILYFHWYELLTTYLLLDLCEKYNEKKRVSYHLIIDEIIDNRLYLNEPIHPVDTVYEYFKQFIKDEKV